MLTSHVIHFVYVSCVIGPEHPSITLLSSCISCCAGLMCAGLMCVGLMCVGLMCVGLMCLGLMCVGLMCVLQEVTFMASKGSHVKLITIL